MKHLPVIIGFGGINAAGRGALHHAYQRLVYDALPRPQQLQTLASLAALTAQPTDLQHLQQHEQALLENSLIRAIGSEHFDRHQIPFHQPERLPDGRQVFTSATRPSQVSAAGQLPSGCQPGALYPSRQHPRGLEMAVYAASDALLSTGLDWEARLHELSPSHIGVYASSAMGQQDEYGVGGMLSAPWRGKRTSAKQCPLGFADMPADFISAYVLGNVGHTSSVLGACATFLYNLERAVIDIQSGRRRFALVGTSEAPITPSIMEGYRVMGALAEDKALADLDNTESANLRQACRPFAPNVGFTIAESAQYLVLVDDELALQWGAAILGSVPGVSIHADGYKKSISAPGVGNYLTVAKMAALARDILGPQLDRLHIQAHGTGTPQNRITESRVLNSVAKAFDRQWPVSAVKCFLGHSLGSAAGDQIGAALGCFAQHWLPGIVTANTFADDVERSHLLFSNQHRDYGNAPFQAALINAKGFGGNNASALLLSPERTRALLDTRHPDWRAYQQRLDHTLAAQAEYAQHIQTQPLQPIYRFGEQVIEDHQLTLNCTELTLPGFAPVPLSSGWQGLT